MFKNLHFAIRKIGAGLGLLTIAGSYSYAQQWENVGGVQTISASGTSHNNLVIDNAGNYFISYYDTSVTKGSVQKFDGTSWSYVGGTAGITSGIALYNSLSLDGLGNIYYTNQGSGLEVRQFNGTSWSQLPSATGSAVNYHASAVSPANILFTYGTHNSGTVQRYVNGVWEQVGNTGFSNGAAFAEMVIGSNNKIYTCNVAGGVRVYENSTNATASDNWNLTGGSIVDASSSGESYTSDIAVDANNNLYVAYVSNSANSRKINVKKFDGNSWVQLGNAYFSLGGVQHVAVAVTPSGQPYVVASRWENDNYLKNTVYKLDTTTQTWGTLGGDFISDGQATYNELAIDKVNNYLVLAYTDGGLRVKRTALTPAPQTCNNTDPGNNAGDIGCVTFNYHGQSVTYNTVRAADGKIWLQQNLGSAQVAASPNDPDSYGDLFQWGRWDDGHQLRNSSTAPAPSSNTPDALAGSSAFIVGTPRWWASNGADDQWNAVNIASVTAAKGIDPCKAVGQGWRMPSQADWTAEVNAEGMTNPSSAYNSNLKLSVGGNRSFTDGAFTFVGQRGYFWSSDVSSSGGKFLYVGTTVVNASSGASRGQGSSVRCIKDVTSLSTSEIKLNNVGVYPNPTNGILYIKTDSAVESVNVINMIGQKINVQFSNNQINMQDLPNGIYIVELKLKNGQPFSKKIIKN
ncbi:hypothetical protein M2347_001162 [Chryseobacterium sp. H1D6B]|uniref:T9SS type A sorting domain-containing protein n=1 Tax=Chryseobacterium sp. H1D6B TaxID=2940588 RepID=UPI0015C6A51C|nr:T9SS type A sorting domain-containing protein [Chryseobacterium sp. H1D6B]MDH6251435.1 hypothetical protein [Chryseobacterium sp. H1D6B]